MAGAIDNQILPVKKETLIKNMVLLSSVSQLLDIWPTDYISLDHVTKTLLGIHDI